MNRHTWAKSGHYFKCAHCGSHGTFQKLGGRMQFVLIAGAAADLEVCTSQPQQCEEWVG